jgi:tRNA modification GTPase
VSDTRVSVLTPPGTGAIATIEVAGPRAWELGRHLFRPAVTKPLPETPELHRFWFGTLADGDEVVLAVKQVEPEPCVEVHCHGGRRAVRWVVEQFCGERRGVSPTCAEQSTSALRLDARQLIHAPTLRTASILLDQYHGAFGRAVRGILADLDAGHPDRAAEPLAQLARYAPVGRHLVEPWTVAIAGPPNAGKSSLVNALAGYQRSVVSAVAGTTRDVVTVPVAFDGWPVELADTAGLRDAAGLEAEGVELAKRMLARADLILWLLDGSGDELEYPDEETEAEYGLPKNRWVPVVNKVDLNVGGWGNSLIEIPGQQFVSAHTGAGIGQLVGQIVSRLVPAAPPPGMAVPYTPDIAEAVYQAHAALAAGRTDEVAARLRACVAPC